MPELWPGGPMQPPCRVSLGGQVYTFGNASMPPTAMAHAITYHQWGRLIPGGLEDRDRMVVTARLKSRDDDLTQYHTRSAAIMLAIRLAGIESGLMGFRASWRLCSTLIGEWPVVSGLLITSGVDPAGSPLWRICAALYRLFVESPDAKPEDRISRRQSFYQPVPYEPVTLFEGSGRQIRTIRHRESSAAFQRFKRQYEASSRR